MDNNSGNKKIMRRYWIDMKTGTVMDYDKDGGCDIVSFLETEEINGSKVVIDFKKGTIIVK